MKLVSLIAYLLTAAIQAYQDWRDRQFEQARRDEHDQIDTDTDAALRDRDWLHESGDGADVPDQPDAEHRNDA